MLDDRPFIGENHSWEELTDLLIESAEKGGINAVMEQPVVRQHYDDMRARIQATTSTGSTVGSLALEWLDQMRDEGEARIHLQNLLKKEAEPAMRRAANAPHSVSDSDRELLAKMQISWELDGNVIRWTVPPEFDDVVRKITVAGL
jgi:hypothetical protein